MIKPIPLLLLAFVLCSNLSFGYERSDSLTRKQIVDLAVEKIVRQDKQNTINELIGKEYANNYIINIDTTNWIEEQGASTKVLDAVDFNTISGGLKKFNTRKDKLRFYVIVINDYVVSFQMPIDPQLVTGVFKWNDLANYPAQQTTVKQIRSNTSTLINNINEALKNKGFTDRIIYFYSKLKVEEYDVPRYYIYDHLGFYGSSIEPIQDDIKSHIKTFQKDAVSNITQAVSSIINSVELVQSGDVTAPVVDCTQSILVIAANTKAIRDKEYNAAIASFVQLVDNPSTAQQKGSRYLVVDQPEKLANDDSFFKAVLPDKLSLLAQPGTSDYKLYVVFKEINFVLPTSEWATFASAIANKSTIAKQANTILMVVPYFQALCTGLNGLGMPINKGTGILMPAVITSGTVIQSQMNAALNAQGTSWETNFNQAYSKIPKKHYQYIYAVNYQFYVVDKKTIVTNNATDYKNIHDLDILVDKRLSAHIALLLKRKDESLAYGGPASVQQALDDLAALKNEEPSFYRLEHGLKESSLIPKTLNGRTFTEIGDQYILWFVQKKLQESQVWPETTFDFNTQQHSAPALTHFQKGYNAQTVEDEFDKLDKAGLALAPFDLDWITDGAGFLLACKYEDSQKKIIYGTAVGAPIVAAYFWRKGAKYFRKADGSFQVAEEMADDAMTLWFKVKSKLKDNLNWTDDVIEQFGKDFGGDAEMLARFDQDPGLVDSWRAVKDLPENVRKNTEDLEIISDYITRAVKSADDIATEIPSNVSDVKKWLGDRKIEPFLTQNPQISNTSTLAGYQIYEVNGSKYIRRIDTENPYTPRLTVDENGVIVRFTKSARISVSAKFSKNLEDIYGVIPTNHQRHHLVADNVVRNSPLYQEAIKRGLYDLDRSANGRYLAETAEDFVHDVSGLSSNFPTHLGSHPKYDAVIQSQIDNVIEQFDVDIFELGKLSDIQLTNLINEIENRALTTLSNWQPSSLN